MTGISKAGRARNVMPGSSRSGTLTSGGMSRLWAIQVVSDHHDRRHEQAGHDAAEKQVADRGIRNERIHDHRNRRRNDRADRRGGGDDRAGETRRIVAALDHHVDRDFADARRVGDGRARHAGKDQADQDIDLRHATAKPSDHSLAEIQKPVGDGAFVHDVRGHNE